jgi:hypothetical protein
MRGAISEDNLGVWCLTCHKLVDREEVVEGYQFSENGKHSKGTFVKVLIKCHGAEELMQWDMGTTEWDAYDVQTRLKRWRAFDPLASHEDQGRETVVSSPERSAASEIIATYDDVTLASER